MLMTTVVPSTREEVHGAIDRLLDHIETYGLKVDVVQHAKDVLALYVRDPNASLGMGRDDLGLSKRERQVVELAARGLSNKEIARNVSATGETITDATVKVHLKSAMRRLGIASRTGLVRLLPLEQATDCEGVPTIRPREAEVLALVIEGKRNKEIAQALDIEEMTVRGHVKNLLFAFKVKNRTELAWRALALSKGAQAPAEAAEPTLAQA